MNEAKAILERHDAIVPKVWPMNVEPALNVFSGPFYNERQIKNTVREHRQRLTKYRKQELSGGKIKSDQIRRERDQRVASYKSTLSNLPTIEKALLSAMRVEIARVRKLQKGVQFTQKEQAWFLTHSQMWKAFHSLHWRKASSRAAAMAIIDVASLILVSKIMSHVAVPQMLEHARAILSRLDGHQ